MDALSSPASSVTSAGPLLFAASREPLLLHTTLTPIPSHARLSTKPSSSSSTSRQPPSSFTTTTAAPYHPPRPPLPRQKPATTTYRRASTGYAAALLDVSRCNNATAAVERDAGRILRAVRGDGRAEEVVSRMMKGGGGLCREVVVLVRMLARKGKAGLVGEVMEEFGRLCDEVSGTRVVLVSSNERIEEEELKVIADEVRRMSGAVKVKVRHVVRRGPRPV